MSRVGSKSDPPEYVGLQLLDCLVQFNRLLPVGRGQCQDAPLGPSGQDAEEVPQVAKGLNAVELAAREQRDEGGVDVAGLVRPKEGPNLSDRVPPSLRNSLSLR